MRFIKIQGKRAIIDLDEIMMVAPLEERDLYVIEFHFKRKGSWKIFFNERIKRDAIFSKIEEILSVIILEVD